MRRALAIAIITVLVGAASASAAWQQPVGGASPINVSTAQSARNPSLAEVNGVPYVAWVESDGTNTEVRVARLNAAGTAWERVGDSASPINESPIRDATHPSLTPINGVPYVAWVENDGTNTEVRVARLNAAGTAWQKVANSTSPINRNTNDDASNPSLTSIDGVPYVAWQEFDSVNDEIRVARLTATGTSWERIGTSLNPDSPINESSTLSAFEPNLTAINGVPHVAWVETDGNNKEVRVARLNTAGNGWEKVLGSASPINRDSTDNAQDPSLTSIAGIPYVAWAEDDGNYEIRVARPHSSNSVWERIGTSLNPNSPINEAPDRDAFAPSLTAIDGTPYVAWEEFDDSNYEIRVARLNAVGDGWEKVAGSASPINESPGTSAEAARLIAIDGIPFVAWEETSAAGSDQLRVSRLEPEFASGQSLATGATTADLSATWHTYGLGYRLGFDYGMGLESSTTPTAATVGLDTVDVTHQVSGLSPSTTYQARPFALAGTATPRLLGSVGEFTTAAQPPPTPPDTTPPETTITKDPPNKLEKSKAKYKFTSNEPNSTFVCKFDKKKPKPCDAGKLKLKRLDDGKHKFKVYAVDAAGNEDSTPAKDKFKVL